MTALRILRLSVLPTGSHSSASSCSTRAFRTRTVSSNLTPLHPYAVRFLEDTSINAVGPIAENSSRSPDNSKSPDQDSPAGDDVIRLAISDKDFLNRFCQCNNPEEALNLISTTFEDRSQTLTTVHVVHLFDGCLERGAIDLCLSIYRRMTSLPLTSNDRGDGVGWPSIDFELAARLVMALTRRMNVEDALVVLNGLCTSGAASKSKAIVFGKVIDAPVPPFAPLTVVQPQEGVKTVACSASRYLFEIFSGEVTKIESEAMQPNNDLLISLARSLKLWRTPPIRAIHEIVVTTPSGISRTFRFATEFSDVPAKEADRISVVCAPAKIREKKFGILDPIPRDAQPGQPLSIVNHATSVAVALTKPPPKNTVERIPSWILPAAVILAGSDAASGIVDPNLPLIGAVGVATLGASVALGNAVVLPRLKQLPEERLGSEPLRQELLRRHQILISKLEELRREASNDIRSLAKLWQLESKMTSVDNTGKYEARLQRIDNARQTLEKRLTGRLELIHGYRRVANMIEIEVEMDVDVPAAEVEGIAEQLNKLEEVENLQQEMEFQIEAQDEVERLLRSGE